MATIDESNDLVPVKRDIPPPRIFELGDIETISDAKKEFARLLKKYAAGELEQRTARTLVYFFSIFLQVLNAEKSLDLEQRMDRIEKLLETRKQNGRFTS